MTGRRALAFAAVGCIAAGLLLVVAGGRPWLVLHLHGPVEQRQRVSGRSITDVPLALGWLAAAGGLALFAVRGIARRALGLMLAVAGAVAAVTSARRVSTGVGWFSYTPVTSVSLSRTAWPWVCVAAGALLAVAGIWVAWRGGSWPGMGERYDAPTAPRAPRDPEAAAWDALDRGDDPTA